MIVNSIVDSYVPLCADTDVLSLSVVFHNVFDTPSLYKQDKAHQKLPIPLEKTSEVLNPFVFEVLFEVFRNYVLVTIGL